MAVHLLRSASSIKQIASVKPLVFVAARLPAWNSRRRIKSSPSFASPSIKSGKRRGSLDNGLPSTIVYLVPQDRRSRVADRSVTLGRCIFLASRVHGRRPTGSQIAVFAPSRVRWFDGGSCHHSAIARHDKKNRRQGPRRRHRTFALGLLRMTSLEPARGGSAAETSWSHCLIRMLMCRCKITGVRLVPVDSGVRFPPREPCALNAASEAASATNPYRLNNCPPQGLNSRTLNVHRRNYYEPSHIARYFCTLCFSQMRSSLSGDAHYGLQWQTILSAQGDQSQRDTF